MAASWVPYAFSLIATQGKVTASNVESSLKLWVDAFHLGIRKLPEDPNTYFMFDVTNKNGRHVLVHRDKNLEGYSGRYIGLGRRSTSNAGTPAHGGGRHR